ncbi:MULTISPECIES: hypothetical protein [unclassified Enterococcus]|uniref:hypothetical protein n=1 Tax=unclassified Enterococcus TaxID=2608891 RepID=UPI000A339DDD|nr:MULTISPECIES: hypothetical protein [unclassified Enterococcus]OTO71298.1 hypothetical protein A5865_002994 [Enterococcus sp. 12E11_DIV0728]OUZ15326.1 hypothetical protein A5868_000234 [Enterococcus sp. 12F9_DIV0723]
MILDIEIGKIYKSSDAKPPAFAKITKISNHDVWNDILEDDELTQLAWGDWYQWANKNIYCHFGAGFDTYRLVPATKEEIAIYEDKVRKYRSEDNNDTEV